MIFTTLVFLLILIGVAGPRWQAETKDTSRGDLYSKRRGAK
ncbi:MAG: hypothetical protein AAB363_04400 [Planctomycetota bacterium]